ncbi:hypothetical protein HUN58_14695 [Curtobacterium sp. Csp1]|uniref:hypothetical protein n=1 Tax=Curtobacterium sp. Csp1 TaxID=2495429 RepID=UPI001598B4D7|nr:hypothetical protein [Curtobacterium sp. Csp1]QKS21002.1 hypothetical protein HUN58_14695 [Curtobacterium sp. Csp1]
MVARFSVGLSSYDDLRGVEQFVSSERMALQFLSVKVDFDQMKADQQSFDRLSVNEGMRSRPRQTYLWNNRAALGVVVAPPFTSRHDEEKHGNAIDIGVTRADGSNRALSSIEFAWLHTQIERRGGTWTGVNFGEPWHHEMATRPEQVPPYPDARAFVAAGPNRAKPTTPAPPAAPPPDPYLEIGEDTMQMVTVAGKAPLGGDIAVLDGLRAAYHTDGEADAYRFGRSMGILAPGQNKDAVIRKRLTDLGLNIGVDELQTRLRAIKKAGGTVDPYYDGKF